MSDTRSEGYKDGVEAALEPSEEVLYRTCGENGFARNAVSYYLAEMRKTLLSAPKPKTLAERIAPILDAYRNFHPDSLPAVESKRGECAAKIIAEVEQP